MAENEKSNKKEPKRDNIIRPDSSLSNSDILKLIKSKTQNTFSVKELGDMFSKTIKTQTNILEKSLNKILKSLEVTRIQSVIKDKVYFKGSWFDMTKPNASGGYDFATVPSLKDVKKENSFSKNNFTEIKIIGFSPEALSQLGLIDKQTDFQKPDDKVTPLRGNFIKDLIKFGMIMTPLVATVTSLMGDMWEKNNPFKGAELIPAKILSAIGLNVVEKFVPKLFGAKLGGKIAEKIAQYFGKGVLKKLPVIGAFFSIGMGLKRINDGDIVGGTIDFLSAFANFIPGIGWPLSLAIDMLNATLDIQEAKAKASGQMSWKHQIKDWFSTNSRYLPGIGSFVHLGEAFGYFSEGDIPQGFKSLLKSGLVSTGVLAPIVYLFENLDNEAKDIEIGGFNISDATRNLMKYLKEHIEGFFKTVLQGVVDAIKANPLIPDFVVDKGLETLGISDFLNTPKIISPDPLTTSELQSISQKSARKFMDSPINAGLDNDHLKLQKEQLEYTKEMSQRLDKMGNINATTNNSSNVSTYNTNSGGIYQQRNSLRGRLSPAY